MSLFCAKKVFRKNFFWKIKLQSGWERVLKKEERQHFQVIKLETWLERSDSSVSLLHHFTFPSLVSSSHLIQYFNLKPLLSFFTHHQSLGQLSFDLTFGYPSSHLFRVIMLHFIDVLQFCETGPTFWSFSNLIFVKSELKYSSSRTKKKIIEKKKKIRVRKLGVSSNYSLNLKVSCLFLSTFFSHTFVRSCFFTRFDF